MGNKYSTPTDKPAVMIQEPEDRVDYLAEFYGKDTEEYDPIEDSYFHRKAENLFNTLQQTPGPQVQRQFEIFIDRDRGLALPYESGKSTFSSDKNDPISTESTPRYLEFVICKGNLSELSENFAVNKNFPDHPCKGNCQCIKELVVVDPETKRIIRTSSRPADISPTSSPTRSQIRSRRCPLMTGGANNKSKGMGSTTTSSPETTTESDEDRLFSETSDLKEISTTDTSPAQNQKNKQNKKQNINKPKESNLDEEDLNLEEEGEEEIFIDEGDDIEDELEDIEGEDITEDGIILSQSDITSSDLYRMQNRIFRSDTTDDKLGSANRRTKDNSYSEDFDDERLTEEMRGMLRNLNKNKRGKQSSVLDTEQEIMNMNSDTSTDELTKLSTKKNNKYN